MDVSTEFTGFELALAMTYQLRTRLLVVVESGVGIIDTARGFTNNSTARPLDMA